MSNDTRTRPLALVTGASSGIGRELARVLAREGYALLLVARRTEPMRELAAELERAHGTPSTVVGADLGTPEGVETVCREVQARGLDVEVLVNNAGYGRSGPFAELPAGELLGMIDLNIRALTALTRAFLPGMVARRRGYILHVASTAAFAPGPFLSVYYASKAYVLSFSHALHEEVRDQGVRVTALCPGYTETEFAARASGPEGRSRLFQGPFGKSDAREVAEAGYRGLMRGKALVLPGVLNWLSARSVVLAPLALQLRVLGFLNATDKAAPAPPPAP